MFSGGGRGQGLPAETEVLGQAWTRRGVTPLREASSSSVGWAEPLCWVLQPSSGRGGGAAATGRQSAAHRLSTESSISTPSCRAGGC